MIIGVRSFAAMFAVFLAGATFVHAQQLYRWTDEKGVVHITDTPPPANAKNVQRPRADAGAPPEAQHPYELAQAMKDFPVTLYTAPNCQDPCSRARELLNKRGVPFREIQVTDKESIQELSRLSGSNQVPVLLVGKSVQKGFEQEAFDALLDSARYPRTGLMPARNQAAPKPPAAPQPDAAKPAEDEPRPSGPYAPRFSK